jgi:hypothetical protein
MRWVFADDVIDVVEQRAAEGEATDGPARQDERRARGDR